MYNFEMTRPSTIADAVKALKEEDAQALGGGQTLIPTLKQRLAMPSILVSLTAIGEMQGVCMSDAGEVCVGGATTHATVAREATACGAQSRDHRRELGQQRSVRLLSGGSAGVRREHYHQQPRN
jgi:CO/xanthine dehydrogenase FAD-binding subunit